MERVERNWLLVLIGIAVAFNAITLSPLVPWQSWTFWSAPAPALEVRIVIADYAFQLPPGGITVPVGEPVRFVVTSEDVTYGFGVFRRDGGMLFQMQVLPGYENAFVWIFEERGFYTVRSTEYSGPEHPSMVVPDAIEVV